MMSKKRTPTFACPDCMCWRSEEYYYKDNKRITYLKCHSCGGVWDEQGNKYNKEPKEETDAEDK